MTDQQESQTMYDDLIVSMSDIKERYSHRNTAVVSVLQFFANDHLPPHLQIVTRSCVKLAFTMVDNISDSSELTDGLRGLLRAKDSFVRARIISKNV